MDEMIRKQIKKFISELSGKDLMGIYFMVRGYYNGKKLPAGAPTPTSIKKNNTFVFYQKGN